MQAHHPPPARRAHGRRHVGVDVARGLAVVLMIQTHAYDAWVRDADRASFAYAVTRQLGAIPAPLFVLLAGVGIGLAEARSEDRRALRDKLVRRGLEVVLAGYALSLAYALLDGSFRIPVILRADILHAIGLSIVTCALVLVGSRGMLRPAVLVASALAAGPLFASAGGAQSVPSPLAPLAALLVDAPPYTRFPLFPLVALCVAGFFAGRWLAGLRGAPSRPKWIALAAAFVAMAALLSVATRASVSALGGPLSRAHPAAVLNVLDGSARALSVLALGLAVSAHSPRWLVSLGQSSLFAYAFHIPFCYARFTRSFKHRLDMLEASVLLLALIGVTLLAVLAKDQLGARLSARRPR